MSKNLVAIYNDTNKTLRFQKTDFRKGDAEAITTMYPRFGRKKVKFDALIPDNSDSSRYLVEHNMMIGIEDPETQQQITFFPFWNDDRDDYAIKYCHESNAAETTREMRGGRLGGDGVGVTIHVTEPNPGQYEFTAVAHTPDENRKKIANAFKQFKKLTKIKASGKYSSRDIRAHMMHPHFQLVKKKAAESGFGSIGLIFGKEQGAIVGKESFTGVLVGFDEKGVYEIKSRAYTAGLEEEEVFFVGLYLSTEPPSKVGGLDFFAEIAVDVEDVGFAFKIFTNFWSGAGFMVMLTEGEEVELCVGIGDTSVKKIL